MNKGRRYNFGLFCVRFGAFTRGPRFQHDAWDSDYDAPRDATAWTFSIIPPFHWPVRAVAKRFGGWCVGVFI